MLLRVILALTIAVLVVFGLPTARTEAAGPCPDAGGTAFVVDTAAEAAQVAAGYVNQACDLIVRTKVASTVHNLLVIAKSIRVEGPDAVSGATDVEVVNATSGGRLQLTAAGGDIDATHARLEAPDRIYVNCKKVGCNISAVHSSIVSSADLSVGGTGGNIVLLAFGDVGVIDTPLYAGALLQLRSYRGAVTFVCVGSPCDASVPRSLHILAEGDITLGPVHVAGTVRGISYSGRLIAGGEVIDAHNFEMNIGGSGPGPTVQIAGTQLTAAGKVRITTRGCPSSGLCIDATSAQILAHVGSRQPCLNGPCVPPYPNVLESAADCPGTGPATIEPAQIFLKARGGAGTIGLCGATLGGS